MAVDFCGLPKFSFSSVPLLLIIQVAEVTASTLAEPRSEKFGHQRPNSSNFISIFLFAGYDLEPINSVNLI